MSSNLTSNYLQFKFAMRNGSKQRIYVFDEFRLDADKLMLYRRGEPVTLPPKVVRTLVVLVEERGSILSKEELIGQVWDEAIVEESNLSQNLYLLRKTLGARPDGTPYIETLRRRGYRFNGEVVIEPEAPEELERPSALDAKPAVSRFTYERRGNVVALVDRRDPRAEPGLSVQVQPEPQSHLQTPPAKTRSLLWILALLLPTSAIGLAVWLNSGWAVRSATENLASVEIVTLTNGDDVTDATMSRDGKYFVYHESDGDSTRMIVRQTGQPTKLEILPKARRSIGGKTLSPDGQSIFDYAKEAGEPDGSIYRVPTLGGVPVRIVGNAGGHPSLSPDGKSMVFFRGDPEARRTSIVIADSSGTRERPVLEGRDDFLLGGYPSWSPDGKLIAYGGTDLTRDGPGTCTVYALEVESGESRVLSSDKWGACFRMEWRRDGPGLVMVGTNLRDGESTRRDQVYMISTATGESQRLSLDPYRKQYLSLAVTDDNDVFYVPFNRASQIWVMDATGSAKSASAITTGSSDGKTGLVSLPDGRIAFAGRTGENVEGWTVKADGSDRRQIISSPLAFEEMRATPDGKYFFFSAKTEGRNHLYRVDADGANLKQITFGDSIEIDSSVSPDGKWIVFGSASRPTYTRYALMRVSIEGGTPTKISDLQCPTPNYSPSGKLVTCTPDSGTVQVISVEDGAVLQTFATVKTAMLNVGAKWSPDEGSIVYIASQKGATNLWVQPLDGRPGRQLTDFPNGDIYNFTYSQDGSNLYLARGLQIRDAVLIKGLPALQRSASRP
jgi:Tol biopolymer transport system component/DNA-binding winged helix-turn-helix (wHTH) protein